MRRRREAEGRLKVRGIMHDVSLLLTRLRERQRLRPIGQAALKSYTRLNVIVYRLSGGRIFGRFAGLPVLLLETRGRRSGRQRLTPVVFMEHDVGTLVVASDGGASRHPAWYLNLQANPKATIYRGRRRQQVVARALSDAERQQLWPELCVYNEGWARYQHATARQIPVVLLQAP